jgi:hypothetical protein
MTREDLVAVATRLFAMYLAVSGLYFAATSVSLNYHESGTVPVTTVIFAALVPFVISAGLWFFPLSVARKLLPVMRDSEPSHPIGSSNALKIGLTLIGVWLLAQSIPEVIYWAIYWSRINSSDDPNMSLMVPDIARLALAGARLVISVLLIVGAARLNNVLLRLRFGSAADGF